MRIDCIHQGKDGAVWVFLDNGGAVLIFEREGAMFADPSFFSPEERAGIIASNLGAVPTLLCPICDAPAGEPHKEGCVRGNEEAGQMALHVRRKEDAMEIAKASPREVAREILERMSDGQIAVAFELLARPAAPAAPAVPVPTISNSAAAISKCPIPDSRGNACRLHLGHSGNCLYHG